MQQLFDVLVHFEGEGLYEYTNLPVEGVLEILEDAHEDKYLSIDRITPADNPRYTEKEFRKKFT